MKQAKWFWVSLLVLIIAGIAYLLIVYINPDKNINENTVWSLDGVIVAYEEDDNGPIIVVRDLENGKLKYLQFVGGVTEDVYGTELKNTIENKLYDVTLQVYYIQETNSSVHTIEMAYIINE